MPELLFVIGSPRAADCDTIETYGFWESMLYADWIEVRASLDGAELVTEARAWSALLPQFGGETADAGAPPAGAAAHERIRLTDLLSCIGMRCGVNIHLEGVADPGRVVGLVHDAVYRSGWHHTQFLVSGRSCRMLTEVRRYDEHIRTGLVVGSTPHCCAELAREAGAYSVHVDSPYVSVPLVRRCHESGVVVMAHGANDLPHIQALARMGVDGIATSYPSRYLRWRGAAAPHARVAGPGRTVAPVLVLT